MSQAEAQVPKPKRFYSDREKAEALALLDATRNLTETARTLGIPDSTLSAWKYGKAVRSPDIPQLRRQISENLGLELASDFQTIALESARVAIKRLQSPQKANKIPFAQLMTGAGIAVDKMQLLRGEPTSITGSVVSEEERQAKVKEVFERIAARAIDATPVDSVCITDGTDNV
jgi:hypothetical protein